MGGDPKRMVVRAVGDSYDERDWVVFLCLPRDGRVGRGAEGGVRCVRAVRGAGQGGMRGEGGRVCGPEWSAQSINQSTHRRVCGRECSAQIHSQVVLESLPKLICPYLTGLITVGARHATLVEGCGESVFGNRRCEEKTFAWPEQGSDGRERGGEGWQAQTVRSTLINLAGTADRGGFSRVLTGPTTVPALRREMPHHRPRASARRARTGRQGGQGPGARVRGS